MTMFSAWLYLHKQKKGTLWQLRKFGEMGTLANEQYWNNFTDILSSGSSFNEITLWSVPVVLI